MKLVVDSKIPFVRGVAEQLGEVAYIDGAAIGPADVKQADALVVRTRTLCNRELLEGSRVQFIATATIGFDHLDAAWLAQAGIGWTNCPGCNARSVAQYVEASLLQLAVHGCWSGGPLRAATAPAADFDPTVFAGLTLGIVGVGHVGQAVEAMARRLGFGEILRCDPPRAEREGSEGFLPVEEVARRADVLTFHTPLTHAPAPHPTFHLADAALLARLKPTAVLFNTSRGEVVATEALREALQAGRLRAAVIDTWENEPCIDPALLRLAYLATPHIAGYSADGKANGSRMALAAVARHFGLSVPAIGAIAPPPLPADYSYRPGGAADETGLEALRLYDPVADSLALLAHPERFEALRGHYPLRRESL